MPIQFTSQVISKPVMVGSDIQFGSTMYNPTVVWYVPPSTTGRVTDPNRTPPSYNPPAAVGGTGSATQQIANGFVVPSVIGEQTTIADMDFTSGVTDSTGRTWSLTNTSYVGVAGGELVFDFPENQPDSEAWGKLTTGSTTDFNFSSSDCQLDFDLSVVAANMSNFTIFSVGPTSGAFSVKVSFRDSAICLSIINQAFVPYSVDLSNFSGHITLKKTGTTYDLYIDDIVVASADGAEIEWEDTGFEIVGDTGHTHAGQTAQVKIDNFIMTRGTAAVAGYSLYENGLFLTSIYGEFSVEVIDSGSDGLHYHINGTIITIDLGGDTGVTAADIAELLLNNGLVTVQIVSGGALWVITTTITANMTPSLSYCPPFGDQQSYLSVSHADLVSQGFAIHTGDFTIEARFRIDKLYEMASGMPPARYSIIGQFDGTLWDGDPDVTPSNWWALEFCNDEFLFRVWDAGTSSYVVNVSCPITMAWAAAWSDPCHDKLNEDQSFVHLAACRYANEVKLFVNGVCDATHGVQTVTDWDEIHQQLEINGQDGVLNPDIPYSITYVQELLLHNYAKWWADFTVSPELFSQTGGLCVYPRISVDLVRGSTGDIYSGKLAILPRIHGHLIKGEQGNIYAGRIAIPFRVKATVYRDHVHFDKTISDGLAISDLSLTRENTRYVLSVNTNQGLP